MTQPRPNGLVSISNFEIRPTLTTLSSTLARGFSRPPQQADHDPFTSPLLRRWADDQCRRLEAASPELDLWSEISRKIST